MLGFVTLKGTLFASFTCTPFDYDSSVKVWGSGHATSQSGLYIIEKN